MTRYLILQRDQSGSWQQNGTVEAHSADAAIRKSVTEEGGTFVAVAASQWKPLTVAVEVKRQILSESAPDPKPEKRIVDGTAEPFDRQPIDEKYCVACERFTVVWHPHHIVGRAQGGDDVPENLAWLCRRCHRILHDFPANSLAARHLVRYCRKTVPELGAYADAKKFKGYVEWRYLGPEHDLEPVA